MTMPLSSISMERCFFDFKLSSESRDAQLGQFQRDGIDASARGTERITFSISNETLDERIGPIVEMLKHAEQLSR